LLQHWVQHAWQLLLPQSVVLAGQAWLQLPLLQVPILFPAPGHPVPLGTFDCVHAADPVAQEIVPFLHGLPVSQEAPSLHGMQLPLLHTWPEPQALPFATLAISTQTEVPLAHEVLPVLHGLLGVQVVLAVQALHCPLAQTMLAPQEAPAGRSLPVSLHSAIPLVQDMVPVWHLLAGVQTIPAMHWTQLPSPQTFPLPQAVPLGALPAGMQTGAPEAHSVLPSLQGSLVSHICPAAQAAHWPLALQTMLAPHDPPAATGVFASLHRGCPPVQSRVPA
jgi:hypothetical protein